MRLTHCGTPSTSSGMADCEHCGSALTGKQRRWCKTECQKAGARNLRLAAIFNLTPAEYADILEAQGGGCAVCGRKPGDVQLPVDHDHRSGFVRGILCTFCNLRVVAKHTDPKLLYRAAEYLENPPARRALGRDVVAPGRPKKKRRSRRKKAS